MKIPICQPAYLVLFWWLTLVGCGGSGSYSVNMMPSPEAFSSGVVNPFTDNNPVDTAPWHGILYATDREPAAEGSAERFYSENPDFLLRLGLSRVELVGKSYLSWAEIRRISLLKNRKEEYPLEVTEIEEYGILDRSYYDLMEKELRAAEPQKAGLEFARKINEKLAISEKKDIYIYIHGYNTNFEDPVLVATEFWHYLGYDGVFIAYSWPATKKGTAYFGDTEKANWGSRHLRMFLRYLCEETEAEKIHIIAYSMGTRVTAFALHDLSMMYFGEDPENTRKELRLGNIILASGDLSSSLISNYLLDGILDIVDSLTIYSSGQDSVLGASNWIFNKQRLGQITTTYMQQIPLYRQKLLGEENRLRLIDATRAVGAESGKGHQYFRSSPWVSSDVLMTLTFDLPPEERGLVRHEGPVWEFPEDYLVRLQESFREAEEEEDEKALAE